MAAPIVIVGATGGMGQAIAETLAARGAALHLVGRDETRLATLAQRLGAGASVADVDRPETLQAAFAQAAAAGDGAIAGLCYAVGTITLKPLGRLTAEDMLRDYRLNALGAALAVQAALPAMKAAPGGASVLLFSTVAVAQGFAAHASIGMAKGAIEGLVLSLAAELAPKIRVNAIAPSLVRTPLAAALTGNPAMAEAIAGLHALGRLGEPADIAPLAALLLSPESGWITGQIIGVDGGRSSLRTKG